MICKKIEVRLPDHVSAGNQERGTLLITPHGDGYRVGLGGGFVLGASDVPATFRSAEDAEAWVEARYSVI